MSKAKIFLIDDEGQNPKEMVDTAYETEEVLQRLLVTKADLLPGDQINPERPRRWLLVKREMGVPDKADKTDRWSLDHLFLDQDGVPTFVECKRASDTRSRREVVAQMLDYAANGLAYWGVDSLRQASAETARQDGKSLDDEIKQLLGSDDETEVQNYWKLVENNLRSGRVRLVFVADEIPKELRRLVEFMNEKMSDVEVLAVEVKQFVGEGLKAVVPRVIGITEAAREAKGEKKPPGRRITRQGFLAKCAPEASKFFSKALDLTEELEKTKRYSVYWGEVGFSIRARVANEDREYASFVYGWPPNLFEVYLAQLPISEQESSLLRQELMAFGIFQEAGKWTLRSAIEGEVAGRMPTVFDLILNKVDKILAGQTTTDSQAE